MSVVLSKRSKPKLYVAIKAQELVKHMLEVTSNEKKYSPNYKALTEDIVHCSESIFINIWTANNIVAKGDDNIDMRIAYQNKAIRQCSNLLALMDLAYSIFHLKGSSVHYITGLTLDLRKSIIAWRESDKARKHA